MKLGVSVTLGGKKARDIIALLAGEVKLIAHHADELLDSNWPLVVTLKRRRPRRSLDQNALYWAWLRIIGQQTGYDGEEEINQLHMGLSAKFFGIVQTPFGPAPQSTRKVSVEEFTKYLHYVQRKAAEIGVILPENPEEWAEQ